LGAGGGHFCVGRALAGLLLMVFLVLRLRRHPEIELAGEPRHAATQFVNQLKSLPVRLRPA
jgi:cholest-4-en-3-one 26-monooxygenase